MPAPRADFVFHLFRGTGISYDEVVERTTLGLDGRWKRAMLDKLAAPPEPRRVLDLASGTGIVSFLAAERWPSCAVLGVELQPEYAAIAGARARERGLEARVRFIVAPAETAPLEAGAFDAIIASYLPKYADLAALAPRLHAALAPGGRLVVQDFAWPADPRAAAAFEAQLDLSRRRAEAESPAFVTLFRELGEIVRRSRCVEDSVRELSRCGFRDVAVESLSMGCAALVTARK